VQRRKASLSREWEYPQKRATKNLLARVREKREERVVAARRIAEKMVVRARLMAGVEAKREAKTVAAVMIRPRATAKAMPATRETPPRNVIARRSGEIAAAVVARWATAVVQWAQAALWVDLAAWGLCGPAAHMVGEWGAWRTWEGVVTGAVHPPGSILA